MNFNIQCSHNLYVPEEQSARTSGFIEVVTLIGYQSVNCIWLAALGNYLLIYNIRVNAVFHGTAQHLV